MSNIADIYFLVEGIIFSVFSLYGCLSFNCGGDILSVCIISFILVVLSFTNLHTNNKSYKKIVSCFYLFYSVILGICLTLVILLLSYNRLVSIMLSLLILTNFYVSFQYRYQLTKNRP